MNALFWIIFCCDYCWRSLLLFLLLQLLLIMDRGYFLFLPNCLFLILILLLLNFVGVVAFNFLILIALLLVKTLAT